ncbi:MAG: nuclear transport factor 2 family protein [Alphaproteobacteria bacterium]|nr:nuclear transport factor 2 family protein [Alphaproteobacteria bacterium]
MLAFAASIFLSSLPVVAESADEAAVAKAVDALNKAMLAADKAALEALVADKVSYGHSSGRLETKAELVQAFVSKKSVYKSIVITNPSVAVTGNSAIVRHVFAVDFESDGKPGSAKVGVMQVWQKQADGRWQLFARQAFQLAA